MERAEVGLEPGGECRFLHALVQLEQMRVAGADSDPDDFRPAFARKSSETDQRKKECFPGNGAKFFRECFLNLRRNLTKKSESEMHLARFEPAHTMQMRIQRGETFRDGIRQLDADEEPLRTHRGYTPTATLSGDRSSAGLLKQKAKMAPIKQRNAPARNGVYPYCAIGFRISNMSSQPPRRGPSKRAALPADWRMPRARPCQLASTICEASPLRGGLAQPLPAANPAETGGRNVRLLLVGNEESDTDVQIIRG